MAIQDPNISTRSQHNYKIPTYLQDPNISTRSQHIYKIPAYLQDPNISTRSQHIYKIPAYLQDPSILQGPSISTRSQHTVDPEIFVLKIFLALIFVRPIVYENFLTGVKLRWRLSNESCVSAVTTCTSAFGRLLWERFFTVNESRQTVETDTLWLFVVKKYSCVKFS